MEWQTRTLAGVIASTVPVEKGKPHPLAELIDRIRLYSDDELADVVTERHPDQADPEAVAAYGFDPEHPPQKEAAAGSFERAMTTLNAPPKR